MSESKSELDGDGTPDILYRDLTYVNDGARTYIGDVRALLSSDGPPAPYTDAAARGWSLWSDLSGPDGSYVEIGGMGDLDGDGRDDLALTTYEGYSSHREAEAWLVFGWDLPWHAPACW